MLPLWAIQHLIEKPLGSIPDFLKGFWNGFKGKESKSAAPAPAGQTYIYEETPSTPEEDNTLLYIGIAAGVIILIIIIIAMIG